MHESRARRILGAAVAFPVAATLMFATLMFGGVAQAAPPPPLPAALGSLGSLAAPDPVALYNSAQNDLVVGRYNEGLATLATLSVVSPTDSNVAALQAFYATASGDVATAGIALAHLAVVDPGLSARVADALAAITVAATLPVNYTPPFDGSRTAIVALGFGLLPDGTMRPELVDRLRAAVAAATTSPASPVVVTGGNPQHGVAEADAMHDWLAANGVAAERIHVENQANSTVQNATLTVPILQSIGATSAVIATSADHIRRATSDFMIAGANVIGATWAGTPPSVPSLGTGSRLGITVDATKVIGIPRTY